MTKTIILILIVLYAVYKVTEIVRSQRKCPEEDVLRDVVLGVVKKESPVYEKVITHLGICDKCQERAREIGSE